eukprot:8000697-Pyramimonas_sp.AAC.1
MAEGSTSEVRRSATLNHVNFDFHTGFIRDLMEQFPVVTELFSSFWAAFNGFKDVTGIGAFRALHILFWTYNAYDVE